MTEPERAAALKKETTEMNSTEFPTLTFEQQDAIEHLIFTGSLSGDAETESLESLGLISRVAGGDWFYAGGPISEFFAYTQSKGMKDGIHN